MGACCPWHCLQSQHLPAAGVHKQHFPNFGLDLAAFMGGSIHGVGSLVNAGLLFTRRRGKTVNDAGIALIIKQLLGDLVSLLALDPGPRSLPFSLIKQWGITLLTTAQFWDYLLSLKQFPQKLQ